MMRAFGAPVNSLGSLERGEAVSFFGRNRVGQDAPHPLRRDKSRPVDSTAAGRGTCTNSLSVPVQMPAQLLDSALA